MSDVQIISLQRNMQYIPIRLPIIVFQKVEQLTPVREVMVGAVCRQKNFIVLFWEFLWLKEQNVFWGLYASLHFCGLRF
jgi:hypothetical protein